MSKKILHVITNYSALGGAEMMLQKLILAQPEFDHHIVSLMSISNIYEDSLSVVASSKALGWKVANTLKTINKLKDEINTIQPDIIQCWMYHANFMAVIAKKMSGTQCPVFWGIHHSLNSISEESLSTKVAIYMNRALSKHAEGIIYCAQSSLEQHKAFGFKNEKQVFIPNGIDLSKFRFKERDFEMPVRVGFVGRFHKAKGIPCLFEVMSAFRDNPNVIFKIAGQGLSLENDTVQKLYEQHELSNNVRLLGPVREMEAFYHDIDVLLMTSITEGFPNVLIEAMATGAVCISTNVGDSPYIIDDNGYIANVNDVNGLVEKLNAYINLSTSCKVHKEYEAYELTKNRFNLDIVHKKYSHIWFAMNMDVVEMS